MAQRNDGSHKIRRGETLAGIAAVSGVPLSRLLAANGWDAAHSATRGDIVHIPLPASRAEGACGAPPLVAAVTPAPMPEAAPPVPAAPAQTKVRPPKEPVSTRQTDSNALLPVAAPTGNSDPTDYGVGAGNTVIVQAAETLGHYADWSGVSCAGAAHSE